MRLYIGNCTPHSQVVNYRLDIDPSGVRVDSRAHRLHKQITIASGRQEPVGGDLTLPQIQDIVDQLTPYGLKALLDLSKGVRQLGFIPYIFNVDKPIPRNVLEDVRDHNKGVKLDEGRERRLKAAIAANDALLQAAETEQQAPFEFSVEQEEATSDDDTRLTEGVRVDHTAPPKSGPTKGRGKKAA